MKIRKIYYVFLFFLVFLAFSIANGQNTPDQLTSTSGDDCLSAHGSTYVRITKSTSYNSATVSNYTVTYSITFTRAKIGIVFKVSTQLGELPSNVQLLSGNGNQTKSNKDGNSYTTTWQFFSFSNNSFTVPISLVLTVNYQNKHPQYISTFTYLIYGSFSYSNTNVNTTTDSSPDNDINRIIGQILGFISLLFLYFSIQFGMPQRKEWIRKKLSWSSAKLQKMHCDLSYLTVSAIFIHLLFLSQSNAWGSYLNWYEFYPTFTSTSGFETTFIGLNIGEIAFCFFLFVTIAGAFFKKIAQKWGYRTAVYTQQFAYSALILSLIHTIINGSWTNTYPVLIYVEIPMVVEILISRILIAHRRSRKISKNNPKSVEGELR